MEKFNEKSVDLFFLKKKKHETCTLYTMKRLKDE